MTFFSKMTEVIPHINFTCLVNGTKLTASLTHLEDTDVLTRYHVTFSDGHKDAFVPGDAEGHQGIKGTKGRDAYEKAISSDLCIIETLITMKERALTNFRVYESGGKSFNVWLCERQGYYNVYYNGAYRFTLRKRDRWEVGTRGEKGLVVNQQLASLVSKHLDMHLQ
jgi:hypothetical protein